MDIKFPFHTIDDVVSYKEITGISEFWNPLGDCKTAWWQGKELDLYCNKF